MQRALLELKAAETTVTELSEKVAALDAVLNLHKPPASDSTTGGAAPPVMMLHEAFAFKLPSSDSAGSSNGAGSSAALQLQRLLPALDAILGESIEAGSCKPEALPFHSGSDTALLMVWPRSDRRLTMLLAILLQDVGTHIACSN